MLLNSFHCHHKVKDLGVKMDQFPVLQTEVYMVIESLAVRDVEPKLFSSRAWTVIVPVPVNLF